MEDLEIDANGNLWGLLHHYDSGEILKLWKYSGNSFVDYSAPITNLQGYFEIDSENNLWFSTWGDSILKFDGNTWSTFVLPDSLGSIPHIIGEQSFKVNKNNSVWTAGVWQVTPSIIEFNEFGDFLSVFQVDNQKHQARIYPNPCINAINIADTENIRSVELIDFSGKLFLSKNEDFNHIDLSEICRGIYLLKIISENNQIDYIKLIKE